MSTNKSLLDLDELLAAVDGVHVLGIGDFCFTSVQTDSRSVIGGTLFVPLIGEVQDGHKYVPQAIEKGASVIFIAKRNYEADSDFFVELSRSNPSVYFIAVENTLHALQNAAGRYVEHFPDLIRVAVTGSSGKTTTKEIAASVLSQKYKVITNKGNLNSETGLPLSVFNIRDEHELGLFEMGMNRENEIGEISAVLRPSYAIVTNIGTAHIGLLGSRENIAKEKSKVFDYFHGEGIGFIPLKDDFADYLSKRIDGKVVCYGDGADERVKFVQDLGLWGTEFSVDGIRAVLSLPGIYNYSNALGAVELAFALGLSARQIADGINSLKPMFGRSEVLKGRYTVVQDCYNANPDSMEKAVDFVSSVNADVKKIFVLGDMLELGDDSAEAHRNVGRQVRGSGASAVIFVGKEMESAFDEVKDSGDKYYYVPGHDDSDIADVCNIVKGISAGGDIVLIKGSRGIGLERLTPLLLEDE